MTLTTLTTMLLAAAAASTAGTVPPESRSAPFHGMVNVAEDGRLRVERIEGVSGALADAVRSQLETRPAKPAVRDGRAVAMQAPVAGRVVLTPAGDDFDVSIDGVTLRPAAISRVPVLYPVEFLRNERAGWVEVEFALDAGGAPVDITAIGTSHAGFSKALTQPLKRWRFSTDAVEVGRRFRLAARFGTDAKQPTPDFQCPVDPAYPHFDGPDGCVDTVSIHGSRVRRHEVHL